MKSKIAFILMFAVAAQAQFIDGYAGYPLLTAHPVQWFSHGQLFPPNFYAYPVQPSYNYRGIAGNQVNSWAYYNPIVLVDANAVQAAATRDPKPIAGSVRTKRQILLRYRNPARRGRSLNDRSLSSDDAVLVSAPIRKGRQIQLQYRNGASRRGRNVNEPSFTGTMPTH